MIFTDDVRLRIEDQVPPLSGKMGHAAQFSQLVEAGQVPTVTPAGFVLPGAIQGGKPDAVTGMFRQMLSQTVIVVLAVRTANDPLGQSGADELAPLVNAVVNAVAGWAPAGAIGDFQLVSAELTGSMRGVVLYEISFSITAQLRITTS